MKQSYFFLGSIAFCLIFTPLFSDSTDDELKKVNNKIKNLKERIHEQRLKVMKE